MNDEYRTGNFDYRRENLQNSSFSVRHSTFNQPNVLNLMAAKVRGGPLVCDQLHAHPSFNYLLISSRPGRDKRIRSWTAHQLQQQGSPIPPRCLEGINHGLCGGKRGPAEPQQAGKLFYLRRLPAPAAPASPAIGFGAGFVYNNAGSFQFTAI